MRSAQTSPTRSVDGLMLPLVIVSVALLGVGLVWVPPGTWQLALLGLLLGFSAWAAIAAWRARQALVAAARIEAEHRMLRESVEGNPMPYAVYDDQDRLIAWNKAYEATHEEAFRHLGTQIAAGKLRYADLIQVTAQATMKPEEVEAHVAERVRKQREGSGEAVDREYPRLGWLRVCKFATPSGAVAGFAVDINELKQREAALEAQIERSQALERQLRELADTDALTGASSRRAFLGRADNEFQRAQRYGHPLCVAMLDIDEFKGVNDRHGHGVGDQVLARVAEVCIGQLRAVDHVGRLGGEEFAILLPETDLDGAQRFAERLCEAIRELRFEGAGDELRVSASVGVSEAANCDGDFSALLGRADAALYVAKGEGRNRVSIGIAQATLADPAVHGSVRGTVRGQ